MAETTAEELKRLQAAGVPANPAKVEFVRDPWGMTSELKKIGLKVASSVRGQKDKQDVLIAQLSILAAHIRARFDEDAAYEAQRRAELSEAATDRLSRQRQVGLVTNAEE